MKTSVNTALNGFRTRNVGPVQILWHRIARKAVRCVVQVGSSVVTSFSRKISKLDKSAYVLLRELNFPVQVSLSKVAFLWGDLDQDKCSKITRIMAHQRNL